MTRTIWRLMLIVALALALGVTAPAQDASTGGSIYVQETAPTTGLGLGYFWLKPSTDSLSVLKSLAPVTWIAIGGSEGGAATWGTITGTLSGQTDLQTALDAKAATAHTHTIANVTNLQTTLDGKALTSHTHAGVYEPANANLQAHVASAHAPSNAQANTDITKAEIEAKLTGEISSHTHAGGGAGATKLVVTADRQNTTTAFANVTDLTMAVSTGTRYVFDCVLISTTAIATTATQIAVNGPTTSSLRYAVETATSATATHRAAQTAYDTNTNPATGAAAVPLPIYVRGQMLTTAAGTFSVRFRSEVAASAVNVLNGSYCLVQ